MSGLIRMVLSGQSGSLRPGDRADVTLTIQNFSEIVDRYHVTVEGIDPSWFSLSRSELSLFPKDQDQLRLTLHPPAGTGTRAGSYELRIHAASQENLLEHAVVSFTLEVAAQGTFEVTLQPARQSRAGEGVFSLQLANGGNADLTVALTAADPEGACSYMFSPGQVSVLAGQSGSAQLRVRSLLPLRGKAPRTFPFTVTARPAEDAGLARQVQGQWEQLGAKRRPVWPIVVGALAGLAAVAGVVLALARPRPPQERRTPGPTWVVEAPTAPPTAPFPTRPSSSPSPPPTDTPRPTTTPVPTAGAQVANERGANLRTGPGTEYDKAGHLDKGAWVQVIAWANDREGDRWLLVNAPGVGLAWMGALLVQENDTSLSVPPAATVPPPPLPRCIAFVSWRSGNADIWTVDSEGGGLLQLTSDTYSDLNPTFSPDGQRIAFVHESGDVQANSDIYLVNVDGTGLVRLTDTTEQEREPAWSPDGRLIAYSVNDEAIYLIGATGEGLGMRRILTGGEDPAWSPDGARLAFSYRGDIYLIDLEGGPLVNLTSSPGWDEAPAWSPDGSYIAFETNRDGNREVYVMGADGSNPTNLTNHPARDGGEGPPSAPAWSADDRYILFSSDRSGNLEIYRMRADGSEVTRLTWDSGDDPAWSPACR